MKGLKLALLIFGLLLLLALAAIGFGATLYFDTVLEESTEQKTRQRMSERLLHRMLGTPTLKPGDAVPAFVVFDLEGERRILETGGQPMLINYWATWCPPCIEEMPLLDRFAKTQGQDGIQVHGIAVDEAADVARFLRRHPVSFPIHLEPTQGDDSSMRFGNRRQILPYTVLIDAEGRLVKSRSGRFSDGEIEAWAKP